MCLLLYILFTFFCICVGLFFYTTPRFVFPNCLIYATFRRTQFYFLHVLLFNGVCFCHRVDVTVSACVRIAHIHIYACTLRVRCLSISRWWAALGLHVYNLPEETRNVTHGARLLLAKIIRHSFCHMHAHNQTNIVHFYSFICATVECCCLTYRFSMFMFLHLICALSRIYSTPAFIFFFLRVYVPQIFEACQHNRSPALATTQQQTNV